MSARDPVYPYRQLAEDLYEGRISEQDVPPHAGGLPSLSRDLLTQLGKLSERFSTTKPRLSWAISQVAYSAAAAQNGDLFLKSLAAWYLGRACNHWTQPRRVSEAISLARRGFEEMHEPGWLAACYWQFNALPWTRPSFTGAARALQQALEDLEKAGFTDLIPDCRLSLAYAQILTGDHSAAQESLRLSEEEFIARGDGLNQARCRVTLASSLRRQDRFEEAAALLEQALQVFGVLDAVTDRARSHYQLALGHLLKADDLAAARDHFERAADLFEATDLDLWRAMCINHLGSVYLIHGQLKLAGEHYQQAGAIFTRHGIQGLLADHLNDLGKLNILMGKPGLSVEQFRQCEAINDQLESQVPAAIAISNLGEAYGQLGRYQDALHHLERAAERLEALQIYFRLATCEKYMASIWSRIGQPDVAHRYLDRATTHYEMAGQKALLASVHNCRAGTFFQQGKDVEAIGALNDSLDIAIQYGIRPQAALANRLLGEALLRTGRRQEALTHLEEAESDFAEMGMAMEQAACRISIGTYYRSSSEYDQARSAFEAALHLSGSAFPESDWRAYVELGHLAESQGDTEGAIHKYRLGMETFNQIRGNFLQPALAGSYLQIPAQIFDHMILTASKAGAALDTLYLIEATKASTLNRMLWQGSSPGSDSSSQELDDLKGEIDSLRNQLRVSLEERSILQSAVQNRQIREVLRNKIEQYDELKNRLERKTLMGELPASLSSSFDIDAFRKMVSSSVKENWMALEYYLTNDRLITLIVTSGDCRVETGAIPERVMMALEACDRARRKAEPPLASDLEALGKLLIPRSLAESISPDMYLFIAPHRALHAVPWPALLPDSARGPLVSLCTPLIVPSLKAMALLWERRDAAQRVDRHNGLLVGLSSFKGRYAELPFIQEEIAALSSRLGHHGAVLAEGDVTWENLASCIQGRGDRAEYAWLHIASHFSPDRHSGRVSGIALSDGDIWLDQLRDLAPLPALVSLSACNSNDSFLYEGDERVDLQTTCFLAGAGSVVGSAWPVPDQAASELMILFYDYFLKGLTPAKAVAMAQRRFLKEGRELKTWASFTCAGLP
jgi:tetratricopeptide (TPR) repeat protein